MAIKATLAAFIQNTRFSVLIALYGGVSWYLQSNHGHYNDGVWIYFALFLTGIALFVFGEVRNDSLSDNQPEKFLFMSVIIFLCYLGSDNHNLIYAQKNAWQEALGYLSRAMLWLSVGAYALSSRSRWFSVPMALIALFAIASQLITIKVSPHPFIDVYVSNTSAAKFFLKGMNPYNQFYVDIYNGAYDYKAGFLYFPGTLYWITPFQLLGDIRLSFVVANALSALGIFMLLRQRRAPLEWCWMAAVAWLVFPITKFVIEQAWTDPVIVTFSIWGFYFLGRNKMVATGSLFGALCLFKQYGFVVSFFGVLAAYRQWGFTRGLKCLGALAIVFAGGMFPFLVWDFNALYFSTVKNQSAPKMRLDALTVAAYWVRNFSLPFPKLIPLIATAGTAAIGSLFMLSKWGQRSSAAWVAILATYGMAFFWGKWAFCNYHYLLAAFFLIVLFLQSHPSEPIMPAVPSEDSDSGTFLPAT